ncbi:MAG: hypothetical protein WB869_16980 [Candidatus Acidiferrales bacterium]|jgi:hypothetical protein
MNKERKPPAGMTRRCAVGTSMVLLIIGALGDTVAQASPATKTDGQAIEQSKFYCNTKALTPTEREQHKQSTDKLIAMRQAIEETEMGYEFQFSPSTVDLAELAHWVTAESKCCPFFDFHIDLERKGSLLCLRLTGGNGIKPFIREEFRLPAK